MGAPGPQELIIVLFIVILLFGAKKLPELAKGLGKGIREFKSASSGEYDDEDEDNKVKKVKKVKKQDDE
ncbi:twin-arginine translocase TatA/TatE family subunit [candidate division KSB1 bacterium]|nr:twin-arginine translocase TatA/TatE family subunit [candidate division KSB1 bacterium]